VHGKIYIVVYYAIKCRSLICDFLTKYLLTVKVQDCQEQCMASC